MEAVKLDYRNLVVGVNAEIPLEYGSKVKGINFDNAANTPAFFSVHREIGDFLTWYSSIHRGKGYKSGVSTNIYEEGRSIVKLFVNADFEKDIVIYTKNATDSINILAYTLSQIKDRKDVVITTWMEHAANDLPWRDKFKVVYADLDCYGRLDLKDLEAKLHKYKGRTKLLAVTRASNVTGYINPIHEIVSMAHSYGAKILVDGAQLVPLFLKSLAIADHLFLPECLSLCMR